MAKEKTEPQFITSALNTPMLNYKVYYMNLKEKIITFLMAFGGGGFVALVFYGNQFLDEDGVATKATTICNVITFIVVGLIVWKFFIPIRENQLQKQRIKELTRQFRGLLEALTVSLSSGMNMSDALISAYQDLKNEYSESAYIVAEVKEMVDGVQNNIQIEKMMMELGERSQIDDIKNFGLVFEICYRAGGNMRDIIGRTNSIISEKVQIADEIETTLSSNKTQFTAMMVVPVVLVLLLRLMSSSFARSFSTIAGIIAMTISICIFYAAYKMGNKIMDIKG